MIELHTLKQSTPTVLMFDLTSFCFFMKNTEYGKILEILLGCEK